MSANTVPMKQTIRMQSKMQSLRTVRPDTRKYQSRTTDTPEYAVSESLNNLEIQKDVKRSTIYHEILWQPDFVANDVEQDRPKRMNQTILRRRRHLPVEGINLDSMESSNSQHNARVEIEKMTSTFSHSRNASGNVDNCESKKLPLFSGVFSAYGDNIITAVRVRPFFVSERRAGCRCIIEMSRGTGDTYSVHDSSIRVMNPIVLPSRFQSRENTRSNINMVGLKNSRRNEVTGSKDCSMNFMHKFHFDHHFWSFNHEQEQEFASQELIYDTIGSYMVNSAFEGFNCSVFAYGQTSAGKTYTMMGDDRPVKMTDSASLSSTSGLVPRVCFGMFEYAKAHTELEFPTFHVSYVEIYHEHVYDLLDFEELTKHSLKIREHPDAGVFVQNARKMLVSNYVDIKFLIFEGNRRRSVATTKSNARSSRSHTILSIYISQCDLAEGAEMSDKYSQKLSKITLVDLAGSERVENLDASGAQLRESVAINRSLSTLADVIHVLSKDAKQNQHIPYRNSVLTRLLKESLGGNTRTIMLAAISPCCVHYEETLGTLKYVDRARRVTNFPHANTSSNGTYQDLREEVLELRAKFQAVKRHHDPITQVSTGDRSSQDKSHVCLEASCNGVAMGGAEVSAASSPKSSDVPIMHEMDTQIEQKSTQTSEQESDFSMSINRKLCIGAIKLLQVRSRVRYLEMYRTFKVLHGSGNQSHELPKIGKRRVVTRFRLPSASPEEDEEIPMDLQPSEVASVYETLESLSSYSERKEFGSALSIDERNREGSLELLEEIATCCCSAISSKHRSICKVKLQQWRKNECDFSSPEDKPSSSLATRIKGKEGFPHENNAEANFFLQKSNKSDLHPDHFQTIHAFRVSTDDPASVLTSPARYQMNSKKYMEERVLIEEEVNSSRFETIKATEESRQLTRVLDKTENFKDLMTEVHLPALEKLYNGLLLLVKKSGANQAEKGPDSPEVIVSENIAAENQENDASKRPEADEQPDTDVRFTDFDSAVKVISSLMEGDISSITDLRTELSEALANARDSENKLAKMRKEQKEASKKINDENNVVLTRIRKNEIHASIKTQKAEQDLRYAQSQLIKREEALEFLEKELKEANDRLAECGSVLEISKDMRTLSVTRLREVVAHKLTKVIEREEFANLEDQLADCKSSRESCMVIISQIKEKIWSQQAQESLAKIRLTQANSEICSAAVAQSSDPFLDEKKSSKYAGNDPMVGRLNSILSSLSQHEKARNLTVTRLEDELNSSLAKVGLRDEQIGLLRDKLLESQKICETLKSAKTAEIEDLRNEVARNALVITELDNERYLSKERATESQNALGVSHEDYLSAIIGLKNEIYLSTTKNARNEEDLNLTIDLLSGSVECLVAQRDIHTDTIARLERELSVISSVAIKTKEEPNILNNQLEKSEALNRNFREINAKLEEELSLILENSNTRQDDLLQAQTLLARAETSREEATSIQSIKIDQLEKEISLTTDKLRRAEEDLHLANNQLSQKEESFNSINLTLTSTINGLEDDLSASLLRAVQLEKELEQRSSRRIDLYSTPLTNKNLPVAAYLKRQQPFEHDVVQKRRSSDLADKEDRLITVVESDAAKIKRLEEELLSSKRSHKWKEEDCRHVQNQLTESMIAHGELYDTHLAEVTRLKEELDFSSSQLTCTRHQLAHSESIYKTSVEIHRGSSTQVHKKMALLSSEMDKMRNELASRQSQLTDSQALIEKYRMRAEEIEKELVVNLNKAAQYEMELTQIRYQFSQRSMVTTSNESQGLDVARLQHELFESLSNTKTVADELQHIQSQLTESTSACEALSKSYATEVTCLKDEPPGTHHQTNFSSDSTEIAMKRERERTQLRLADYESSIIALTESHAAVTRRLEEDAFSCRKEIKKLTEELRGANARITDFWPSFEALMNTHAISTTRLQNEMSLFHISTAKKDAEHSRIIEEIGQLSVSFAGLKDFLGTMSQPYNPLPAQSWASKMETENGCLVYQHNRINSSFLSAKHKQILAIAELNFVKSGGARAPQREDERNGAVTNLISFREPCEKAHKSGGGDKKTYPMQTRYKDETPDESAHIYSEPTTLSKASQQNLSELDPASRREVIAQSQSQNHPNALEVNPTQNSIAVCKEGFEATYQQITHLEREFNSFSCKHDKHIEESTIQLKRHRDHLASISADLPSLRRNVGQRIQTHLRAESSLLLHQEYLSAQVARLEKKLASSTNFLIQAEKKFNVLQQSSGGKITQLEDEVLDVSAQLGTLQGDLTQQDACLAVALGELKAYDNSIQDYEADVERGKEREEFLSASITAISSVSVEQIGELERKVSILESKCKHLKEKLSVTEKNEALFIAHTEKLTSQISDLDQKVNMIEDQKHQVEQALCTESKRAIESETSMQELQSHVESLEKLSEQRLLQSRECQLMQISELTSCNVLRLEHIYHVYQEEIGRQFLAATEWEQKLNHQTSTLWQMEEDFRAYVKSNTQKNEHLRTVSQEQAFSIERLQLELNRHLMYIEDISVYFHVSDFGPRGFRVISPRKEATSKRITSHHLQNLDDWFEQNISINEDKASKGETEEENTFPSSLHRESIVSSAEMRDAWTEAEGDLEPLQQAQTEITQLKSTVQYLKETLDLREDMIVFLDARIVQFEYQASSIEKSNDQAPAQ
uniref:Uncharacterized protein AlNc14C113G6439 n=1 Tax=Albugo laibachii Nc14 TaxID=890382 RepID=F0WIP6_9STRA|nr:hypothetical protein BRAFLDRAFT_234346 [Albugo laibachii Nc14]|eukprot:CCA21137.1 hypothetical protein BRAFLDRAFT_234346 [Albugo laibachii Nc14]